MQLVDEAERDLASEGRVLLRYSGTEPKVRLLIEGRDAAQINAHADRIAQALQVEIGA
jgi:phosphoglucosamine mutase